MMPSLEYISVFGLLLVAFPFSMGQMEVALNQEDIEGFCLWLCIATLFSGLPFMMTVVGIR